MMTCFMVFYQMKADSLTYVSLGLHKKGRALLEAGAGSCLIPPVTCSKYYSGVWIKRNCIYFVFEKLEKHANKMSSSNVQLSASAVSVWHSSGIFHLLFSKGLIVPFLCVLCVKPRLILCWTTACHCEAYKLQKCVVNMWKRLKSKGRWMIELNHVLSSQTITAILDKQVVQTASNWVYWSKYNFSHSGEGESIHHFTVMKKKNLSVKKYPSSLLDMADFSTLHVE